jgi:hypothetical protein
MRRTLPTWRYVLFSRSYNRRSEKPRLVSWDLEHVREVLASVRPGDRPAPAASAPVRVVTLAASASVAPPNVSAEPAAAASASAAPPSVSAEPAAAASASAAPPSVSAEPVAVAPPKAPDAPVPTSNNLRDVVEWLRAGDVVVLHNKGAEACLWHKCVSGREIDFALARCILVDVGRMPSLMNEGEWDYYLLQYAQRCECPSVLSGHQAAPHTYAFAI